MPRCPLCRSALVTITFGLYPIAICTSCSARWIQGKLTLAHRG